MYSILTYLTHSFFFDRQGSRGFHSNIVIIDEYSFVPSEVLYENALIQLIVAYRSLFVISSPDDAESDRMMLLTKVSTITDFLYFNIVDLGTVCQPCTNLKKLRCPHLLDNRSRWKSMQSQQMLETLLPAPEFAKEVLGARPKTHENVFEPAMTEYAFSSASERTAPTAIYGNTLVIAIDTCSGGGPSMMGITIICSPGSRPDHIMVLLHSRF